MRRFLISVLILASLALAACSGASSSPNEIVVKAEALKFSPETIEVTAGRPVKLMFENTDSLDHDLSVMEFPMEMAGATQPPMAGHDMGNMGGMEPDLHVAALMGQKATLEFTPTKPGTYEFFCTVAGHKEAGMKGTLVVKAP
jgi:plastocyanin